MKADYTDALGSSEVPRTPVLSSVSFACSCRILRNKVLADTCGKAGYIESRNRAISYYIH